MLAPPQLVFMLTPLATAMANKALLKQPTPYKLWPTVFVTLAGSVLIVVGNYLDTQHQHAVHGNPHSVHDMAIGLSLAVVSMLLLTAYLLSLQVGVGARPCAWQEGRKRPRSRRVCTCAAVLCC